MGIVKIRMFPRRSLAGLAVVLGTTGCAVVGYPAPTPETVTVAAGTPPLLEAPLPPRIDAVDERSPVRTYEVLGRTYTTLPTSAGYLEVGVASWYGEEFHGRRTASGETFDMHAMTAAHRTLPLSTCVEVRRVDDDRRVVVRVNDRGPFGDDTRRIIDLSYSAGRALGLIGAGTAEVEVRSLEVGTPC
jgi:rare lipoprotein A